MLDIKTLKILLKILVKIELRKELKEVLQEAGIKFMSKGGLVKSGKPKLAKKGWK
jgi:hypothetical protein